MLECLQKSLRIAHSAIEQIVKVQLSVGALDEYLYFLNHRAPAVRLPPLLPFPPHAHILVPEIGSLLIHQLPRRVITSWIDGVNSPDVHPSQRSPPGLTENVQTLDIILCHFRNTLLYIQTRKNAAGADPCWDEVDVVGAMLKMGLGVREQDER